VESVGIAIGFGVIIAEVEMGEVGDVGEVEAGGDLIEQGHSLGSVSHGWLGDSRNHHASMCRLKTTLL
jgi:hypothetical protein